MVEVESLCCPNVVPVSAFRTCSFLVHFTTVLLMCAVKVRCRSRVMPSIFGLLSRGRDWLFIVTLEWTWCSCLLGVRRVVDDLAVDTDMQLPVSHGMKSSMYAWSIRNGFGDVMEEEVEK